jgi:hypothetical protein
MPRGGAKKGERRGGRQKGTPNKLTKAVKEVFEEAFEGLGGSKAFIKWGKDNQTDFYKLYARLIPQDVNAKHGLTDSLADLLSGLK